ncbi:MAG: phosphoribosylanthranilate isomerase [Phycisphaeraceae bacterium]|nr:MAG: phosphoribosylanthranilate isomerase [Phycisphaeraceae bacterium]
MPRTRIKICGVRTPDIAIACAEAGADAIGLVFHEPSPRYIPPEQAWRLIAELPPFVATVGLTVNASVDQYTAIEEVCPTDYGQLHGEETEKVVQSCGPRIFKAVRFNPDTIENDLKYWSAIEEVDAILIDGSPGGRGESFDWAALAQVRAASARPLILAGGLTPDNVGEAIRAVRPYAVDVSSGVETAPGEKDADLIRVFCDAVRAADAFSG